MKKQFKIAVGFLLMHGADVINLKAGVLETEDESLIKALNGSKGAKALDEGSKPTEETKPEPDNSKGEDTELLQLRAEYESKIGKKPHHNAGKDKLKSLIADYDKQQDK